jgi:nanoRNase/pAp phosphatase (c-di-AMP/oligoRNAs hydrolase)
MDATKMKPAVPSQFPKGYKPTWQESVQQINAILTPAKEAVIILKPHADFDTLASGLALGLSLKKIGRRARIVTPTALDHEKILNGINRADIPESFSNNLDQIVNYLPQKQLIMTVDYTNGSFSDGKLDKTENGLVLTLVPEPNQPPIEPLNINTQIIESKPDVIFTIELENLFNLNEFYRSNQNLFTKFPVINIDNHSNNMNFGKANLIDPKATSISEMVTLLLYDLRFTLDEDISKMLYSGMKVKTDNFSQKNFSANMLEAASISMRYQQSRTSAPQQ